MQGSMFIGLGLHKATISVNRVLGDGVTAGILGRGPD